MQTITNINSETFPSIQLDAFIGQWNVESKPAGPKTKVIGDETFEWFPDADSTSWKEKLHGEPVHEGISVVGCDAQGHAFFANNYEDAGCRRKYALTRDRQEWHYNGENQRATMRFDTDGNALTIDWEITEDGKNWHPLCTLKGVKKHAA